jgi:hypothetical protein
LYGKTAKANIAKGLVNLYSKIKKKLQKINIGLWPPCEGLAIYGKSYYISLYGSLFWHFPPKE